MLETHIHLDFLGTDRHLSSLCSRQSLPACCIFVVTKLASVSWKVSHEVVGANVWTAGRTQHLVGRIINLACLDAQLETHPTERIPMAQSINIYDWTLETGCYA